MAQQQQQQQINSNGNGAGMNGMPMIAGQQMDVNFLYQKVVELSEVLKDNREKTQAIIASAEELAVSKPHKASEFSMLQWSLERSLAHNLYGHRLARLPMELRRHFKKQMLRSLVRPSISYSYQRLQAHRPT